MIHPIVESPIFEHFGYPLEVELLLHGYRKGFLGVLQLSQSTLALLSEQVKVFPPCSLLPAPPALFAVVFNWIEQPSSQCHSSCSSARMNITAINQH